MNPLRRLRALFRREQLDAEMNEEMRHHLDAQMRRNLAAGMSLDQAHYAALRSFGGVEQIKERARDERRRGFLWLEHTIQDVRFAIRTLRKNLGFTTVVAVTLAIGIGLNTVVFSFYSAIALKRLPVRHAEEILRVSSNQRELQGAFTFEEIESLRARLHSVESLVAISPPQLALAAKAESPDEQEPAALLLVSEN